MCSGNSQADDMKNAPGIKNGIVPAASRAPAAQRAAQCQNSSSITRPASMLRQAEEADLAVAHLQSRARTRCATGAG